MSLPEVTAIVVNWNGGDYLTRCVKGVLREQNFLDLEVVVVDNASSDSSLKLLGQFGQKVRLIQNTQNLGFSGGVNRGVASSDRPYILVMNPDVYPSPGSLTQLVNFMVAEPAVGLVGPRLLDREGQIQASCGMGPVLIQEIFSKFLLHLLFPFLKFGRRIPSKREEVGWVTGACFAVHRQAFLDVGGLDEAFFMYYEDVDFCLRLRRAGWRVFCLPEARVTHLGGESSKQALEWMLIVSETSYIYFIEKQFGRKIAGVISALGRLEMVLRILLWISLYVIIPRRKQEALARLRAYRKLLWRGFR